MPKLLFVITDNRKSTKNALRKISKNYENIVSKEKYYNKDNKIVLNLIQ